MVYGICALFGTYLAHSWQTKICSNILKGKLRGENEACQYVIGLKILNCFGYQSVMVG